MIDSIGLLDKFMHNNTFKNYLHKMGSGLKIFKISPDKFYAIALDGMVQRSET